MTTTAHPELEGLDRYRFGWADPDTAGASARRGCPRRSCVTSRPRNEPEPGWLVLESENSRSLGGVFYRGAGMGCNAATGKCVLDKPHAQSI